MGIMSSRGVSGEKAEDPSSLRFAVASPASPSARTPLRYAFGYPAMLKNYAEVNAVASGSQNAE
jgi:hypothetical protein